jgi:hypothetical protein
MALEFYMTTAGNVQHAAGSPVSGGSYTITSPPSTKVKADGNFIYRGPLNVTFSGGNLSGMVPGSVNGAGAIVPTSTKNLIDGQPPIRDGDTGTLTGTAQPTGAPPPPPVPVSFTAEAVAGQNVSRGE